VQREWPRTQRALAWGSLAQSHLPVHAAHSTICAPQFARARGESRTARLPMFRHPARQIDSSDPPTASTSVQTSSSATSVL
jgi:hypothetical protein